MGIRSGLCGFPSARLLLSVVGGTPSGRRPLLRAGHKVPAAHFEPLIPFLEGNAITRGRCARFAYDSLKGGRRPVEYIRADDYPVTIDQVDHGWRHPVVKPPLAMRSRIQVIGLSRRLACAK